MNSHTLGVYPSLISALVDNFIVGVIGLVAYIALFVARRKAAPPTGSMIDVVMDTTVISGAVLALYRIYCLRLSSVLTPDEHVYMILGAIVLIVVLGKRLLWNLCIAWRGRPPGKSGVHTEDAWPD